jgi:hypothetical protein
MYEHNLIFQCEACKENLALSVIRQENNLESVDSTIFDLNCPCGWKSKTIGIQAKRHWTRPLPIDRLTVN